MIRTPWFSLAVGVMTRSGTRLYSLGFAATLPLLAFTSIARADAAPQSSAAAAQVFSETIRPLFAKHCLACHGGVKQASGLSLVSRDSALTPGESGLPAIVPGTPDESYLVERVSDPDPDLRMPPAEHGPALSPKEIESLRQWIAAGAPWPLPWSLQPPRDAAPPAVRRSDWCRDSLDRFVLARIEAENLEPAGEATRSEWLRRVTLDLTGLPPTAEEYRQFAADNRPNAHEAAADRLLASPRYGERWASMWLDLARYADTQGFESDHHRDAWPYRDWVIAAFNDDMPYNEFTVKQLAGDLLPNATYEDRLATGFHRNTQTNAEGGTDDEEYRLSAVVDRVNTTWQAWQGLTFRCTQCHSHPYDPFRHEEYYRFMAFFNTSRDEDVDRDYPLLGAPKNAADVPTAQRLDDEIAANRREQFAMSAALRGDESQWRPLRADTATATGQTQLVVRDSPDDQVPEVWAEGTITAHGSFTIEFPLPAKMKTLAALRIDALPKDPATAAKIPEAGFALTRLKAQLLDSAGGSTAVAFDSAVCDEAEPQFDPVGSLQGEGDAAGWSQFTRMNFRRHAVFFASEAAATRANSRLRLELEFHREGSGGTALVIERGRFAASADPRWTQLATDSRYRQLAADLPAKREQRAELTQVWTPVMAEQPAEFARRTYVFQRGNWLDKGEVVACGVPAVMPPLPDGLPPDRLAMARWIASPENPLTARVMVNRLWQELFGTGIVETAEDFGSSGTAPSHPELLDHLALRFQGDMHWSVKRLLRAMVLSATYRQSGRVTPQLHERDPRNRLLARGPRNRLPAEMVRDQALLLSGKLSTKMYGPPVMPPQPEGVWRSVYSDAKWVNATGEDRYRRAVYTYCKRTSGYPAMLTFDMPSRDVCVARRLATNTPLQALTTLNDEAFVELAAGFGEQMERADAEPDRQIAAGYFAVTGGEIAAQKLARLRQLYDEALAAYDADAEQASRLAADRTKYATAIVANALLNLDEALTK
jgi:mono/diheme cytochrome c family protein